MCPEEGEDLLGIRLCQRSQQLSHRSGVSLPLSNVGDDLLSPEEPIGWGNCRDLLLQQLLQLLMQWGAGAGRVDHFDEPKHSGNMRTRFGGHTEASALEETGQRLKAHIDGC